MVLPSGEIANPHRPSPLQSRCPFGVRNLPLGRMVVPPGTTLAGADPAGGESHIAAVEDESAKQTSEASITLNCAGKRARKGTAVASLTQSLTLNLGLVLDALVGQFLDWLRFGQPVSIDLGLFLGLGLNRFQEVRHCAECIGHFDR